MASYTHRSILTSKKIELKTRIRLFDAYISSIFLYNSEVWSLTKTQEHAIDVFQRSLLGGMLRISWPYTLSNDVLYERTGAKPWSENITMRRMKWVGHLLRLPAETPARQALQESLRPTSRVNSDIRDIRPDLHLGSDSLAELKSDRRMWRAIISPNLNHTLVYPS
ncbi:hypothetical protein HOLleu_17604 [Holothuria leucospilota]|uniref:Uncharacterized protein n=1 Tax=Holothuria leucospilota TaxID=206669 RepID=A0A9Q1C2E0_HOLLE|nr:hypothetical protein HOLleu_17604 [Holothuria leucospilota]